MARNQERNSGNSPKDQASIEWMRLNGELEPIDPEVDDIPYPAKMRWSGDEADEGSPWQIPPPGLRRCKGKAYVRDADGDYILDRKNKRIMRPCWNWAMVGTTVCIKHGGGVARVKRSALERLASSLDATTGELVRLAIGPNVLDEVRLRAINSILDRVGVRGGVEVDIKDPGYLDVLKGLFEGKQQASEEDDEAA